MDNAITSLGLFPLELLQPLSINTNFVALLPTLPFPSDSSVGLLNLVLDILVSATTLLSAYTSKMKDDKKWEVFWRIYLSSFLLGAVSFFLFQIASSKTLDLLLAKSALWLGLAVISFYFLTLSTSYSLAKIAAPPQNKKNSASSLCSPRLCRLCPGILLHSAHKHFIQHSNGSSFPLLLPLHMLGSGIVRAKVAPQEIRESALKYPQQTTIPRASHSIFLFFDMHYLRPWTLYIK